MEVVASVSGADDGGSEMSKLEELMALARECGNIERRHCIGKAQGFDVRDAYEAIQSALKAVVEDAERWRAFLATRPQEHHEVINAAIDAARKP